MPPVTCRRAHASPSFSGDNACMAAIPHNVPSDALEALQAFGVAPTRLTPMSGNTTAVLRVDADDSSFVLRRRAIQEADRIAATHDLLRYLAPLGVAPQVRMTRAGEEVAVRENALFELLTFLPGEVAVTGWDFDWDDDELLASAGDLLGRLTVTLREYVPPPSSEWYPRAAMPDRSELELLLRRENTAETRRILDGLTLVEARLAPPPEDRTRRHIVHNDFGWYNVVRTGRSASGVIDFDSALFQTELHDIAYAVYAFAPVTDEMAESTRSPWRTAQRVRTLLAAYEDRAGSLPITAASLLDMAAHRVALSAASLLAGLLNGEERARRLLPHTVGYVTWLEWYERRRRDLVEAVASELSGPSFARP